MKSLITTAMIGSGVLLIAGGAAHADIVQNSKDTATQILSSSSTGQSFTAVDPLIASIGFSINDFIPTSGTPDLTVTLFDGSGFGGSILDTQTILFADIAAGPLLGDGLWNDFVFNSPIALTVGNVYTAQISTTTSRWGYEFANNDPYAGGVFFSGGAPFPIADAKFRVFAATTVIPLPSALSMGLAGLGFVAVGRRRR